MAAHRAGLGYHHKPPPPTTTGGDPMGLTDDQLTVRREFIGGSDMAALAGVSPFARPIDVYLDKVGEREPRQATAMMALGTVLEPVVARLFEEATGYRTRRRTEPVRDPHRPWLGGHIDRWVMRTRPTGVLECKWSMSKAGYGDTGTDVVPAHVAAQLQHYLGVTGRQVGYVAALLGYADFRWFRVPRDDDAIGLMRELADRFWHDHVVPRVPPEPDGSDQYTRFLAQRYPRDTGDERVATPAQVAFSDHLRAATARRVAAEEDEAKARQRVMDSMADTATLLLPNGRITWRAHQQQRTDWLAVASDLAPTPEALATSAAHHVTTTTVRPFRATFEEASDDTTE